MDLIKYDMTDIWASAGDVVAPDSAKITSGWGVEVVPRQWWNWFENRQDNNIAYMLQKGFPEWDATTEYIINKSYVQRNGTVYKATATSTGSDPVSLTSWVKVFADYSASSNALGALTPAANAIPYFTSTSAASTFPSTAYGRGASNLANIAAALTYFGAQAAHVNLTALSGVTAGTNVLPYFNGTTTMTGTTLTAFGRSLIDDADAATARTTLGAAEAVATQSALDARQPLNTRLTSIASLVLAVNDILIADSATTMAKLATGSLGRSLIAAADAGTARTLIGITQPVSTSATIADFNTLTSPGWQPLLYSASGANAPTTAAGGNVVYWYVHVNNYQNASTILQVAYPYGTGASAKGRIAWRNLYQGVWTDWSYSATTQDIVDLSLNAAASAPITGSGNTVMSVSPALTGTPTAPTAAVGTNTTQIATTAFVIANSTSNPPGAILAYAGSVVPTGYLVANGATISRTTYAALFAAIGTTYGAGDGSTTFRIPELRGEFLRGLDNGRGVDASRTLGSAQADQMESHNHTFTGTAYAGHTHTGTTTSDAHTHTWSGTTSSAGAHSHNYNVYVSNGGTAGYGGYGTVGGKPTTTAGDHTHTVSGTTSSDSHNHTFTTATGGAFTPAGTIAVTGGTTNSSETRPRNVAVQFLIKF